MRNHRRTFGSPRDTIIYRVRYSETLRPGLFADAILVELLSGGTYHENENDVITVLDSMKCNCYFPGEYGEVLYDGVTDSFTPVGSHGLTRRAVANATISIDSSGSALFKTTSGATAFTGTAHLKWMHGGEQVSNGKQILCHYLTDEQYWLIIGAECEA